MVELMIMGGLIFMSGDWTISGWSRNKDEDKITNEKADTEETKSANVEFTGD